MKLFILSLFESLGVLVWLFCLPVQLAGAWAIGAPLPGVATVLVIAACVGTAVSMMVEAYPRWRKRLEDRP